MGVFGAPTAYGDDPERAVRAAFAVRDWAEQDGLEVRVAVNTGEAIVELDARPGHGEAMVAGDVVNTAARLQSAAPVGSVLVGEETYAATRNAVEYRPAQPVLAKGKSAPVRAWLAVRATSQAGERPMAPVPMIGRDRELAVLTGIWERVTDEARSQFVTVFGPAGIGKSRLGLELAQIVAAQGARVIRGRSTPYGASAPYSAFAQQVKQVSSIFDSDEPEAAREKLARTVAELAGPAAAEEHVPQLEVLLGLAGERDVADRETLFFSARVLVETLAMGSPTLLLYEDIHWADSSQLDLLETLAARVHDVPVLLVALARPELLTERATWGAAPRLYRAATRSVDGGLEPRARPAAARRVRHPQGAAAIVDTAEGNPLFIEELAASIAEESTSGDLPTSVHALIAARLDALPPDERSVLIDASVLGRVFWRGALARMAERDDLSRVLGLLEERDLVRREAVSRIQGDQQFAFKHALIQEVAYLRLPRAERRTRHAAVASYLDETTGDAGQANEALAHHWQEAGENRRAVDCLVVAADQAGRGWAKEHAVSLYRAALNLIPEEEVARSSEVKRRLAVALMAMYHVDDAQHLRPS